MTRRYLRWALVAFVAYSLVAPLLKLAMADLPSTTAVFLSNLVMFLAVGGLIVYTGRPTATYLTHPKIGYVIGMGVLLTISLLAYYRALALGPVSVVVPIYGLYIALSSIVGILFLDESMTTRKLAGISFGVLAIVLISI